MLRRLQTDNKNGTHKLKDHLPFLFSARTECQRPIICYKVYCAQDIWKENICPVLCSDTSTHHLDR